MWFILWDGEVSPFMFRVAMLMLALMFFCLLGLLGGVGAFSREGGRGLVPCGLPLALGRWLALLTSPHVGGCRKDVRAPEGRMRRGAVVRFCERGIGGDVGGLRLLCIRAGSFRFIYSS